MSSLGAPLGACTYCGFCEKFGAGTFQRPVADGRFAVLALKPHHAKNRLRGLTGRAEADRYCATGVTFVTVRAKSSFSRGDGSPLRLRASKRSVLFALGDRQALDPTPRRGRSAKNRVPKPCRR